MYNIRRWFCDVVVTFYRQPKYMDLCATLCLFLTQQCGV